MLNSCKLLTGQLRLLPLFLVSRSEIDAEAAPSTSSPAHFARQETEGALRLKLTMPATDDILKSHIEKIKR